MIFKTCCYLFKVITDLFLHQHCTPSYLIVGAGGRAFCNLGDFCALLSLNYDLPILEYFRKNAASPVNYYLPVYGRLLKAKLLTQKQGKRLFSAIMWT